jgi:hypothetical protein
MTQVSDARAQSRIAISDQRWPVRLSRGQPLDDRLIRTFREPSETVFSNQEGEIARSLLPATKRQ